MKNENDNRILIDLDRFSKASFQDLSIPFSLLPEEMRSFPNLISLDGLVVSAKVTAASMYFTVSLFIQGSARVKDAHDGEERHLDIDDSVDVVIAPHDEENSDILPDEDGQYDLRGSILALLYDAIPDNYSEVPLTRVETEDYVLMSEEEYQAQKAKKDNPFSALDDFETEDK